MFHQPEFKEMSISVNYIIVPQQQFITEYPIHKQALYISTNIAFTALFNNCLYLFQCPSVAHILLLALHSFRHILYIQQRLQKIRGITRKIGGTGTRESMSRKILLKHYSVNVTQNVRRPDERRQKWTMTVAWSEGQMERQLCYVIKNLKPVQYCGTMYELA